MRIVLNATGSYGWNPRKKKTDTAATEAVMVPVQTTKVSATRKKQQKNFQGFSLSVCRYIPDLVRYVKVPKRYGLGHNGGRVTCCGKCFLPPCCVEEWGEMVFLNSDLMLVSRQEKAATARGAFLHHFRASLGKRYTKKFGLPRCAEEAIKAKYPS